jgi:enamine deaminase RidA (YjgF/YER057c/UK114 family)
LIETRADAVPNNFTPRHREIGIREIDIREIDIREIDIREIDMAASPNLRFINPSTMSKPPGTRVVEATGPGRIVYIAGQLGLTLDGKLAGPPGDFRAQATQAFENLKNALAAVGAGFEHVVKLNNYLTDIRAQLPLYRDVREGYVSTTNPPASTTVEVSKLAIEGALYEVEAIAMLPPR